MTNLRDLFNLKDTEPNHHIKLLLLGKILLILALVLLIKPAFTGHVVSNQFERLNLSASDVMDHQIEISEENNALNIRLGNNDEILNEIKERNKVEVNEKNKCLGEKSGLEIQISKNQEECDNRLAYSIQENDGDLKKINDELDVEKLKYLELEKKFNDLGNNSAKNICCKLKVDDNSINSYSITNNKVTCGSGEVEVLSC
jgi:hypothetical protein